MHEHFLDLLDKIHDNVGSIKEIYSGEFGDVWPLSKMIEKLNWKNGLFRRDIGYKVIDT